jgi:hypothetical protein
MNAGELLALARELIDRPDVRTEGLWPRAAAFLGRQALESALADFWRRRAPDMERHPYRTQLICLNGYMADDGLVAETTFAWYALSRACHHHPYELDPTAEELGHWFTLVERFILATADTGTADTVGPAAL